MVEECLTLRTKLSLMQYRDVVGNAPVVFVSIPSSVGGENQEYPGARIVDYVVARST